METGLLERTLFLMPPRLRGSTIDLPAYWAEVREGVADLGLELPGYRPAGMLFWLGRTGKRMQGRYLRSLTERSLGRCFARLTRSVASKRARTDARVVV